MTRTRRFRARAAAVALCAATTLAAHADAPTLPAPPFALDCGARGGEERDDDLDDGARRMRRGYGGIPVLPDVRYGARHGYGHRGGETHHRWFAMDWGLRDTRSLRTARQPVGPYRFDLPPGRYVVALDFCEGRHHVAGRRVFDVVAQGIVIADAVDPAAIAGHSQGFRIARPVTVEAGGALEVGLRARAGEPLIHAIRVWPFVPRRHAPSPPGGLRVRESFAMNVVQWRRPLSEFVRGWVIQRRGPDDTRYRAIHDNVLPVTRWIDRDVVPGSRYVYRVASVDVLGRRGPYSSEIEATPRSFDDARLPVYRVDLDDHARRALVRNVEEDHEVAGTLRTGDATYPIEIRVRGASTRLAAKLGYRVRFLDARPPGSPKVVNLKAAPSDPTLLQETLTCGVFRAIGLPVSRAAHVNLAINGEYQGVYVDVEPIRSPFKTRAGLDPNGTLIRAQAGFGHLGRGTLGRLRGDAGSVAQLEAFIERCNRVERGDLAAFARHATDWPRVRDYLVATVLCHRSEIEADDYFWYRDSRSGRWSLIPWDHNNGNFGIGGMTSDGPGEPFMPLFGQTLQGVGHQHGFWYVLPSRIFHDDSLRAEYLNRLEELTRGLLLSGKVAALVDSSFARLREDALADPFRWPPTTDEPLLAGADNIKRFVRQHGERLLRLVAEERSRPRASVVIDEFLFGPRDGWVELHNRSDRTVSLAGWSIGDVEGRGARQRLDGLASDPGLTLAPDARRVFRFPYRPLPPRRQIERPTDDDPLPVEELERLEQLEIEERERRRRHFAGFDPRGGTIGLFAPTARDEDSGERDDRRYRIADWYFYGPQDGRRSYGRTASGFGHLTPTPGAPANE